MRYPAPPYCYSWFLQDTTLFDVNTLILCPFYLVTTPPAGEIVSPRVDALRLIVFYATTIFQLNGICGV